MLRITVHKNLESLTFQLEGKLAGIWATMAFVTQSTATNSAPWRACPLLALPRHRYRSHVRIKAKSWLAADWATVLRKQSSSSRTQGPASFPSSWNVRDSKFL